MPDVKSQVLGCIDSLLENDAPPISDDIQLIGNGRVLDSMNLVELCLKLEDLAADLGFEFDWTSAAAMSKSRSMFRTAGTLAFEFERQMLQQCSESLESDPVGESGS